jgi:exodeoxyribonuclease X
MNLAFTDTETTGVEEKDRLCQLAYRCGSKDVNSLFKPPLPINLMAMAVHHITEDMVAGKPAFIGSKEHKFLKKHGKNMVFVAHNAKFDLKMLEREGITTYPASICTLKVVRHLDENANLESHKLQYLRYLFNIKIDAAAHDAWGDILVLELLFHRLRKRIMRDNDMGEAEAIAEMIEISTKPSLVRKWMFGKHRGEMMEDTLRTDRGYLEWMLRTKLEEETDDDEDLIHTLQTMLDQ